MEDFWEEEAFLLFLDDEEGEDDGDYRKQQRDAANKHMKAKAHGPRF